MAVAQRHDSVGQYGLGQHHPVMAPPSFNNFGYPRPKMEDPSETMWPVPRVQQQQQQQQQQQSAPQQGPSIDRSFGQPEFGRPFHQANYTYDGSSSTLRNPVVYSQSAPGWGLGGPSSYEYPTASYMAQRAPMHGQSYLAGANGYSESSLHAPVSDAYPKVMGGPAPMGGYDHAETMWPLGPNSLDAFAGMPAPTNPVARLTLTSSADKKLKPRTSLPPPKQFKCSACDAIFSRNHDLKRHARIHLAVKPFPCGYCDKAFSRKDALKRHVLVKGCGIGNKKSSERKRAATLSKLEHSEGGNANRPPYDGVPSGVRDFGVYQHGGQGERGGFQSQWPLADPSNPPSSMSGEYPSPPRMDGERASSHALQQQMPQASYGSHPQGYTNFMGSNEESFPAQQRQQLAGGLVNAFTSPPPGTSVSSPTESQHRYAPISNSMSMQTEEKVTSRPGSGKMANQVPFPGQPFNATSVGSMGLGVAGMANEQGFGQGHFAQQQMPSPSLGGPDPSALKRQHHQHGQFGAFLGNNIPH